MSHTRNTPVPSWVYNKLTLAEKLEYVCGPAGIKVPKAGEYIIRPMMNLAGMGANAKIIEVKKAKFKHGNLLLLV